MDASSAVGSTRQVFDAVAGIITPFASIAGLLYFFGWIRTGAIFGYFGIDQRVLQYSLQDYVLRSAGVAFRPLSALLLLGLGVLLMRYAARRLATRAGHIEAAAIRIFAILGTFFVTLGAAALFGIISVPSPLASAVVLALGAVILESIASAHSNEMPPHWFLFRRALFATTVAVCYFWGSAVYAQQSGITLATSWEAHPEQRPGVAIYSVDDLQLSGPGLKVTRISANAEGYAFRYSGLRLLTYSNNRWFLIPEGWSHRNSAPAIVLRDDENIRVETFPAIGR